MGKIGVLTVLVAIFAAGARAAESWTDADFEPLSAGAECPARIALRQQGDVLKVAVDVDAVPGATRAPTVTLGLAAANTLVLGPQDAVAGTRSSRWLCMFSVPSDRVASTVADWATLRLAVGVVFAGGPYDQPLYRARYRHQDGRALHAPFSPEAADWLPFDLTAYTQRVADRGARLEVEFEQPIAGKATIIIEDGHGRRVRNLIGGETYAKGRQTVEWDLLNDAGKPVDPGTYRWRSLHHAGIRPEYLFAYCNDGNPPWKTGSGTDMWGPDHSCFTAAAACGDRVYVLSPVAEAGCQGAIIDLAGVKVKSWWAGSSGDRFILASDGKQIFVASDNGKRQSLRRRCQDEFQPFDNGRKEIVWGASTMNGLGKSTTAFIQADWDGFSLAGFASAGKRLVVSSRADQAILVFDAASGERVQSLPLLEPGALAGLPDGTWFAVSAGAVLRFAPGATKPETLLKAGGLQPGAMAAGADSRLYVVDKSTHQIAVLDALTGREKGRLGTPGGAYAGKYDPARMVNPMALTLADNGWLWVVENRFNPKRVLAWDVKSGRVVKEKFGPSGYGSPGSGFDSGDTTRFVGQGAIWKVDVAARAAVPASILFARGDAVPSAYHWRFLRRDGRTFLLGYAGYNSLVELLPDGSGRLLAQYGSAQWLCLDQGERLPPVFLDAFDAQRGFDTPEKRKRGLGGGRLPSNGELFVWSDINGDGVMQADELEFAGGMSSGFWGCDAETLDIAYPMMRVRNERPTKERVLLRLPLQGWHPSGAPHWRPLAEGMASLAEVVPGGYWEAALFDRNGTLYANGDPLVAYGPDLVARWSYPNHWNGVQGSHHAPLAQPGQMQGALFFLGNAPLADGKTDVFVLNGNHGRFFVLTSDGFYLDELFSDVRSGAATDAYFIGGEAFGGFFGRGSDGQYYLICGHTDYRIFRLNGLDTILRVPGGQLAVTPAQVQAAARRAQAAAVIAGQPPRAAIARLAAPPRFDGSGLGWPASPTAAWDKDGQFPVTVQAGWDAARLYLRWSVADPSPWKNNGQDDKLLFKTGDSVDLQIGCDPGAPRNRTVPVPGDQRLLIAPFGKEIAVMLYRYRVPGTKQPVPFCSPWRTENVDEVRRLAAAKVNVSVGHNAAGQPGYIVEAAIPLAELGLEPTPGRDCRADFGAIFGDPGGQVNQLRSYWANKATGLVNDVPGEIILQPDAWGTVSFEEGSLP